ncbi:PspC domain-containing protein [Corynebacterium uberis]|uniref:PspC domain-containing protein n=1 Tax=Corynebacterium sp. c6VSa_13 TaxID=2913496 RepID=UPI001D0A441F|nr:MULTISPECIES: PspC domain-containing protein [Corynebacterium]MCZ9309003.1 PspC domain-containing protein [Corynebacterium sp. c6VSa_13]UDL74529.1 PspC domain-containing protein [Corynebacterium uberis]UDL76637.1 PspC domain-containing protein [Corynebacterium uberis]UDL78850.1 PspC domain-containing protein [Corynebacterium uberis]UDL81128.1 PspC domain-containing protein [Corynebacterium uberis]
MTVNKKLHRSTTNKWIGGVCGGIAETYDLDATVVRLLAVASFVLPGTQVLLYLVAWVIMPRG